MHKYRSLIISGLAVIAVVAAACGSSTPSSKGTGTAPGSKGSITVGSTNFPEQVIVANIYADVLTHAGYKVTVRANLGTREIVEPALQHGQIDLYPEYAGSLLNFLNKGAPNTPTNLSAEITALGPLLSAQGIKALTPAPAVDENAFVVTKATAAKYHLTDISSLAPVASQLRLGGPPECPQRPLCLLGLQNTYGLHFKSFTPLDEAGPITVSALSHNSIDVAELFSSDGSISQNNFVVLTDNKNLQPSDNLTPLIRVSVDTAAINTALDAASAKLTTSQLSGLNTKVNVNKDDPATVAKDWAQSEGLLG